MEGKKKISCNNSSLKPKSTPQHVSYQELRKLNLINISRLLRTHCHQSFIMLMGTESDIFTAYNLGTT